MNYCKLLEDGNFELGLYSISGDMLYPYVPTYPSISSESQIIIAKRRVWLEEGKTATGQYQVIDVTYDEEVTEQDKDQALSSFGVDFQEDQQ